ncbi:mechanosensitive ion channel protein Msy2 [Physcia stellaris]|nr:mechanosensitive ion channel protein Msy2 [Physcia stellaris]
MENEKAHYFKKRAAGRRKAAKDNAGGRKGEDGEEDTLTQMGQIYNKILNFSIVTRYFLYVLPLAIIIAIPIIIGATAAPKSTIDGHVRIVWFFSWVEIVWLSLWVSKLAAKALPTLFQFLCGIVSSGTRKYALVLKALEIPLSLAGWALAALATFIPIMTRNPDQRAEKNKDPKTDFTRSWELIMQKVLAAFMVAALIFLAEKLLIQIISIGYHRTQFTNKIKDSKHNVHLLSLLYDASRTLFPAYCNEFAEEDYIINDSLDLGLGGSKKAISHARSGSATPMRLIQNVGRIGDKITSAFGNIASEVTGKQVFQPDSAHSIVVEALEKNKSSEALAKRLWMSFVVEGKDALYQDDIEEVLGHDRTQEAEECFSALDRDGNGDISLDEMILTVCEFGRERHSIANSLHDVDQAINVLDSLLCTIVFVMVVFVFIAFLNSSFTTTLATAGTALLSLSFVFSGTAQEVLGSCIFLFVKHPFDVLDRVDIGAEQLVVEHISLLYTVFRKANSNKLTQSPNVVLNSLWIDNISRSKAMREELLIYVHFDTTLEDIQLLKNEMRNFVRDKENCRDFQPDIEIEVTGISEMNKMELQVEIKHKSNWANETVRSARRSKFMCALVLALRKIPIYAPGGGDAALGSSDKPTYSVTVSDAEAAKARDAYAATKEGKRMVPTKKPSTTEKNPFGSSTAVDATPDPQDPATPPPLRYRLPPLTEQAALTDLNSRDPAADTALDRRSSDRSSPPNRTPASEDGGSSLDRKASIEEVRGLLRRQSTRGKRRPSGSGAPYASAQGTQSGLGLNVPTPVQEGNDSPSEYFGQMAPPPQQQQGYPRREQSQDPYLQQAQRYQGQQGQAVRPGDLEAGIGAGAQMRQVRQPAPGAGNSFAMDRRREE